MSAEKSELLATAKKRNKSIPHIISENRVLQERRESRTAFLMLLGDIWFIRNGSTLTGQNHLETAMKLIDQGEPFTAISNHLSDADHAIRRFMLEHNGYREFADRMLYLAGLKMIERPLIRQVASAEKFALIPTPNDMKNLEDIIKSGDLSEEERTILRRLKKNYVNLSRKAKEDVTRSLGQNPEEILALYPESTRSRTGMVIGAEPLTNMWYRLYQSQGFILPIAIEGGDYMQPPGTAIPFKRINAKVTVAEPVPIKRLEDKASLLPKEERPQFLADYAFSFVVNLLDPKYVPAAKRQYFKQFATL